MTWTARGEESSRTRSTLGKLKQGRTSRARAVDGLGDFRLRLPTNSCGCRRGPPPGDTARARSGLAPRIETHGPGAAACRVTWSKCPEAVTCLPARGAWPRRGLSRCRTVGCVLRPVRVSHHDVLNRLGLPDAPEPSLSLAAASRESCSTPIPRQPHGHAVGGVLSCCRFTGSGEARGP